MLIQYNIHSVYKWLLSFILLTITDDLFGSSDFGFVKCFEHILLSREDNQCSWRQKVTNLFGYFWMCIIRTCQSARSCRGYSRWHNLCLWEIGVWKEVHKQKILACLEAEVSVAVTAANGERQEGKKQFSDVRRHK